MDSGEGYKFFSNELFVSFIEGTESNRIKKIISDVGGTIVGSRLRINELQIHLAGNTSLEFAKQVIKKLKSYPEIKQARLYELKFRRIME